MQEQVNLRALVMDMLLEVMKNNTYSHIMIREVLNKYNYLEHQEKAFIKRLFEGTLERTIELDYHINQFSNTKVNKMKPVIRTIMRMSVYQILYMDSVPDAAACNEAVKLAQKKGFVNLKGFVNGVLRNIARNKDKLSLPDPKNNRMEYLSVKYSMPLWIIELWKKQYDLDTIETIVEGLLEKHPVTVRFRTEDAEDIEAVRVSIEKLGGTMQAHPYLPYAYRIEKTDDLTMLPGFSQGKFVIQDVSSMLAVESIGITPGMKILEICAAPGGKTMLAADSLKGNGSVEARDVSFAKVDLMDENFTRCKLRNVNAVCYDALDEDAKWIEQADVVIADIPCSGLGIMGKKRDIKYKITPEGMDSIVKLQRDILQNAVKYVKPGGKLLFSTCTIRKEENEDNVLYLKNELKMTPVSLNNTLPQMLHGDTTKDGYLQLLPGYHDTDGFFISVFQKM